MRTDDRDREEVRRDQMAVRPRFGPQESFEPNGSTAVAQWRKLTAYSTGFYNEVFFFDNQHGWITSFNGTVLRTANGVTTWQSSSLPNAQSSPNRDIRFVSSSTGFISGDDGIWKTTDGGASWTNVSPSSPTISGSTSCWSLMPTTAFLVSADVPIQQ